MQSTEQVERASPPHFPISPEQVRGEGDNKKIVSTSLSFSPDTHSQVHYLWREPCPYYLHKASQPSNTLINELINRDSLQLTHGFDLKRHYGIKRHDHLNAPDDKVDAGIPPCRPRNNAGATACHRRASTTIYGHYTGEKSWPDPRCYQIYNREVPSDQDRLQEVLRWTRGLDNLVQGLLSSAIVGCADALTETAGD